MNFSELGKVIDVLSKEKGIDKGIITHAIEQAFLVTTRKKFGIQGEYETKYNAEYDDIEIFQFKNVVEDVRDNVVEIPLEEARKEDPDVEVGDQLGFKIEDPKFTRVDIQTVKQIIMQKVRDAEREILFSEFKHREGDLITGIARRYERGNIIVDLGKADAVLSRREIIPGESFNTGDRIQAYLSEVVMTNRGPEIRLSRTSPMFLVKLFELEVPEIQDGTIEIKSAAREPGQRAKIAVQSVDKDIDPVGACVGMKGSRVQNVVNELRGEKIDIVKWNDDLITFTTAALAPSEIENIGVDHEERSMDVVVEEDQLSLAIGRRGQNVRLAAMLTGYKINIISKVKLQEKVKLSVENLLQIPALNEATAQVLVQNGVMAIGDFLATDDEEVASLIGLQASDIATAKEELTAKIEEGGVELQPEGEEELVSASAVPQYKGIIEKGGVSSEDGDDAKFSEAEKRLREELAAFKIK